MKIKPEHLAAAPAQAISQPGGFDAGDMASAAAQGYRDGWAAAQAATGPTWAALNHAWHKIGCDAAGMDWGAFTNAAHYAPSPQADSVLEDAARYRWLREGNDAKHGAAWQAAVYLYGWDAAIDAARAIQKEQS